MTYHDPMKIHIKILLSIFMASIATLINLITVSYTSTINVNKNVLFVVHHIEKVS